MTVQKLWDLQKIRIKYEEVKEEYKNSLLLEEIKSLKGEIKNLENEIEKILAEEKEIGRKARKCYQKEIEMEEKEGELKEKLYGGSVSNLKELEKLQVKLGKVTEEKGTSADEYLELSILQEDLQKRISKLEDEHQQKKIQYATARTNFQN